MTFLGSFTANEPTEQPLPQAHTWSLLTPGTCGRGRTLGVPPGDTQCLSASCRADQPGPRRAVTGSLGCRREHTATPGSVGSGGLPMPRKPTGTRLHWAAPRPRGSRSRETGLRVSTGGGLAPRGSALHPRGLAPVSTGSCPCPSAPGSPGGRDHRSAKRLLGG